jgi:hypothetical protein
MESEQITHKSKDKLTKIYLRLNPVELKRGIDEKIYKLFKIYEEKQKLYPLRNRYLDPKQKVTFSTADLS